MDNQINLQEENNIINSSAVGAAIVPGTLGNGTSLLFSYEEYDTLLTAYYDWIHSIQEYKRQKQKARDDIKKLKEYMKENPDIEDLTPEMKDLHDNCRNAYRVMYLDKRLLDEQIDSIPETHMNIVKDFDTIEAERNTQIIINDGGTLPEQFQFAMNMYLPFKDQCKGQNGWEVLTKYSNYFSRPLYQASLALANNKSQESQESITDEQIHLNRFSFYFAVSSLVTYCEGQGNLCPTLKKEKKEENDDDDDTSKRTGYDNDDDKLLLSESDQENKEQMVQKKILIKWYNHLSLGSSLPESLHKVQCGEDATAACIISDEMKATLKGPDADPSLILTEEEYKFRYDLLFGILNFKESCMSTYQHPE